MVEGLDSSPFWSSRYRVKTVAETVYTCKFYFLLFFLTNRKYDQGMLSNSVMSYYNFSLLTSLVN